MDSATKINNTIDIPSPKKGGKYTYYKKAFESKKNGKGGESLLEGKKRCVVFLLQKEQLADKIIGNCAQI